MALHERNRMLQILYKNGVCRNHVKKIMDNLKEMFEEDEIDEDTDWELADRKAVIRWHSDLAPEAKREALQKIDEEQKNDTESIKRRNKFFSEAEKRVREKMEEMERMGLTGPEPEEPKVVKYSTRYGRSPLHEAIVMRDIRLIKKYVGEGLYLDTEDNNGHSPMEMAYYEGYKEAMAVFRTCKSKK